MESGYSLDHHYQEEVSKLKESLIWTKNLQVRDWLESKWFSIPEVYIMMWVIYL